MDAAMTRSACCIAEGRMGAGREGFRFVGVARAALDLYDLGGMREFFNVGVAVFATENGVGAGGMLGGVDGDALPSS